LPSALLLLRVKIRTVHTTYQEPFPPPRVRNHVASFFWIKVPVPQAAFSKRPWPFKSPLTCLGRAVSPASERRSWERLARSRCSSSSPWSDLYGPVSTRPLPTKPYRACCHSPLGPSRRAGCFSRRHVVFIGWLVMKGQRGGNRAEQSQ
jgi:hypothetical protein